ncbi:hypothetical protein B7494_g4566 [Chlorociboria aeruginascens]|nr:hypothetical protein B7494_g4566 [Chlorociboria aeruginascens]
MPDKPLTIATYAAGASLAAITLVYVFAPTYFIDGDGSTHSASSRKKGVVGLMNPANDCFINSVLQALAGLGDLRIYLIRETHRRKLDGPGVYRELLEDPARKGLPEWKIEGLQKGIVTQGLKDILDALNERPLYKKTISAAGFVAVLEVAFRQKISRQQQDAQEFLQVVAERLCDEYHAGHRARIHARDSSIAQSTPDERILRDELVDRKLEKLALDENRPFQSGSTESLAAPASQETHEEGDIRPAEIVSGRSNEDAQGEEGFPFEGGSESQIECLTCGFKPKPTKTTFCSLTLSVPQVSSTSLNACFDGMFKTEYIEDFKCEKCRLVHAVEAFQHEMAKSNSEKFKLKAQIAIKRLEEAIETNPEEDLKGIELPDSKFAPKRKIAKHVRITHFPKILAIHLSRSIFDASRSTLKNSAKVTFPERLPLGGLLDRRKYKLLSVVCHKGSHHSGHYESFRRQNIYPPYSTPNTFASVGVYSRNLTPMSSRTSTPEMGAIERPESLDTSTLSSTPELLSPNSGKSSTSLPYTNGRPSTDSYPNDTGRPLSSSTNANKGPSPTSAPRDPETSSIRTLARSARETLSKVPSVSNSTSMSDVVRGKRKKKTTDRWWRISDEKIKESKTSEVLGMQKEVYMLFYEIQKGDDDR